MGQWVSTNVAFGIDLGQGIPNVFYLTNDPDEEYEKWDGDILNFFETWKESKGENFNFPFDIVSYYSYEADRARYFLAYEPSIQSGGSSEPLYFSTPEFEVASIKKMIEEHGFGDNVEPKWAVLSLYG